MPDPQSEETFLRSKLTRHVVPGTAELFRAALALRRELPAGDAEVSFDEGAGWLQVRRGPFTMIANLGRTEQVVPVASGDEVVLATQAEVRAANGSLQLPALAGAVLR